MEVNLVTRIQEFILAVTVRLSGLAFKLPSSPLV
jgi:hypothetical protein